MNKTTLRKQMVWLALFPALLLLLLLLVLFTWLRLDDAETSLDNRGVFTAQHLAYSVEYGLLSGNLQELEAQAQLVLQQPDIQSVEFLNVQGVSIAMFKKDPPAGQDNGSIREYEASVFRQPIALSSGDDVLVSTPEKIGFVRLQQNEVELSIRRREIFLGSVAPAVFAILVAVLLAQYMANQMSRPILILSELVQKIRSGDYLARGAQPLEGELGYLQEDINQLAATLQQSRQEQDEALHALSEARKKAEAASQAKSDFLAMMSHELRTPLNGVQGMLQLLDISRLMPKQSEYVTAALESTDHLMEVINDILDFSRIESGRMDIENVYFSPVEIVNASFSGFQFLAEKKGLNLKLTGLDGLIGLAFYSDPTRLRQVLMNLLSNAIKFTSEGEVELQVGCVLISDNEARFSFAVLDTGIGIAEDKIPKLFEAFSQADTSTSRRFGGTGLGLSIASRLMEMLGGKLDVQSEEGKGSVFSGELVFKSKLFEDGECVGDEDTAQKSAGDYYLNGKILLVEDNEVNSQVAQNMLMAAGAKVIQAFNGQHALELLFKEQFDCVLMDVQMPIMDGLEATQFWRQQERDQVLKRTPIVALTANALSGEQQRCLDAGMDDYLSKPFLRQELLEIVSRYLR